MDIRCHNKACRLSDACQTFTWKATKDSLYIRPKIIFDEFGRAKQICDYLIPHNIRYINRSSSMNHNGKVKKMKVAYEIIDEFGNDKKDILMKKLRSIMS